MESNGLKNGKRKQSFWIALIRRWKKEGEPPKYRFALENDVPPSTFSYWLNQLEGGRTPTKRVRKIPTSVALPPEQYRLLRTVAERTERSIAEVLRRGAELVLEENADVLEHGQEELQLAGTDG